MIARQKVTIVFGEREQNNPLSNESSSERNTFNTLSDGKSTNQKDEETLRKVRKKVTTTVGPDVTTRKRPWWWRESDNDDELTTRIFKSVTVQPKIVTSSKSTSTAKTTAASRRSPPFSKNDIIRPPSVARPGFIFEHTFSESKRQMSTSSVVFRSLSRFDKCHKIS